MRRVTVITPPAEEPISLADAKDYLRIDQSVTADDAVISAMISAARRYAEHWLGRVLITQTLEYASDGFPFGESSGYYNRTIRELGPGSLTNWLPGTAWAPIEIPRPPLQSIVSVQYYDQAGAWQTLDPSAYQVSKSEPARISPAINTAWPITHPQGIETVRIQFIAGYGDASAVPPTIRAALLLWVAFLYENRGEESAEPPAAVQALLYSEDYGRYG
jgi:hypothetical protein